MKEYSLEDIVNKSSFIIIIWDENERDNWPTVFVSENIRIFGFEPEDFHSGKLDYNHIIHPNDLEQVLSEVKEYLKQGITSYHQEYRILTKDKQIRWVEDQTFIVIDDNGNPVRHEGIIHDITARKTLEKQRESSEDLLIREIEFSQNLIDSAPMFFIAYDEEATVILWNKYCQKKLGYPQHQIIGDSFLDTLILPNERNVVSDHIAQLIDTQKMGSFESHILTADGEELLVEWYGTPLFKPDGNLDYIFEIGIDVTLQRKIEAEFFKNQKIESIGLLAGGIAHDFNNILTVVLGNLSILEIEFDNPIERSEILEDTVSAVVRAKDLTRQLLTFSKGGAPIKEIASIQDIIQESSKFVSHGTDMVLEFRFQPDLWSVNVDLGQMAQVVQNLTINAYQASPSGSTITFVTSNETLEQSNEYSLTPGLYVKTQVVDHGKGIPPEILDKIFDLYFSTKPSGSGLGLSISHSIVKKHGGILTVKSEESVGTSFIFFLPAAGNFGNYGESVVNNIVPNIHPADTVIESSYQPKQLTKRVLILEDEDTIRSMQQSMLIRLGFDFIITSDGHQTIAQYQKAMGEGKPFDWVILDLTILGGLGGEETMRRLLKIDPNINGIVSSGYAMGEIVSNYRQYGFKQVLVKPYTLQELMEALNSI